MLHAAGDADFICNYLGNEAWTNELEWTGAEGFRGAQQEDWTPVADMSPAGLSKTYGGFTFLRVFGAGHMVRIGGFDRWTTRVIRRSMYQ